MKRDLQLIRKLLLFIEDKSNGSEPIRGNIPIEDYTEQQIHYHLGLLTSAGLIKAIGANRGDMVIYLPITLTWDGHEFLDAARNETIWKKTMSKIGEVTESIAIPLLKELLLSEIRSRLSP